MASNSKIEWTTSTWNPVTGCSKISLGCQNCYAERYAYRLKKMGQPNYLHGFQVTLQEHALEIPLRWKKPHLIFVNSMSDLFHEKVSLEYILKVFKIMHRAHWHTFQILTKRSERLKELNDKLIWSENIWMGVSVENTDYTVRINHLKKTNSRKKFISFEPLLEAISGLDLEGIDWVIVGGESGPKARSMKAEWVRDIRDQCQEAGIPFFFKQWGGINRKKNGRILDGQIWEEMPQEKDFPLIKHL